VACQGKKRRVLATLLALGVAAVCCARGAAEDLLRFSYDVPGDSKAIVLHADSITTWVEEGGQRVILLKGKVLVDHGVVQVRMSEGVVWVEQARIGVTHVTLYGQGTVNLDNGGETRSAPQGLIDLTTRGEIKLRSHKGKVTQQPQPNDPLYRKAVEVRTAPPAPPPTTAPATTMIRQAFYYQEPTPTLPGTPTQGRRPNLSRPRRGPARRRPTSRERHR
jgi:hypothetical protein